MLLDDNTGWGIWTWHFVLPIRKRTDDQPSRFEHASSLDLACRLLFHTFRIIVQLKLGRTSPRFVQRIVRVFLVLVPVHGRCSMKLGRSRWTRVLGRSIRCAVNITASHPLVTITVAICINREPLPLVPFQTQPSRDAQTDVYVRVAIKIMSQEGAVKRTFSTQAMTSFLCFGSSLGGKEETEYKGTGTMARGCKERNIFQPLHPSI